ncbi:DUF1482 family protein [Escherichia coli]
METLFALVLTISMTNGEFQDVVLDVYDDKQQCEQAAIDQKVSGNCYPVERIVRNEEVPAETTVKF